VRKRKTTPESVDWLVRLAEAIEYLVKEEKRDRDPPWARRIPHDEAKRFVRGVKRYARGDAKSLDSALEPKRRGRRVSSFKPESLKQAESVRRLRQQGMAWEDIAQTLFGDRSEPPTVQYLQVLVARFTPVIEAREHEAFVQKIRRRLKRRQKPPKPALKQSRNQVEAIWVDPRQRTPKGLMRMVRRQQNASRAKKRRDPS
jgi:hypothetical protein